MGIVKTYMLETQDAVASAHYTFYKRHGSVADTGEPEQLAEPMGYAKLAMTRMGWDATNDETLNNLESELIGYEEHFEGEVS
jgi:hypothetical protein